MIKNFVRQILNGLAYLHSCDIIHRDIKGANILVDNKGGVKISDFGISKRVEASTVLGTRASGGTGHMHRPSMQGSVYWMAPEVVRREAHTEKADIWSLGCLVVEMFIGAHPFPDCSQLQAIFAIGSNWARPPAPEHASKDATAFLDMTFQVDFKKRPSAEDLLKSQFLSTPLARNTAALPYQLLLRLIPRYSFFLLLNIYFESPRHVFMTHFARSLDGFLYARHHHSFGSVHLY